MSIEIIFPTSPLSEAEEQQLLLAFSAPIVVKYLKPLATEDSKELLGLGVLDIPAESLARRHSFVSGKLSVVQTLLSISQLKE